MTIIQILDRLKSERNITIIDFCYSICFRFNYSRNLNNEQKIPSNIPANSFELLYFVATIFSNSTII